MGSRTFNGTTDLARIAAALVTAYPFTLSIWAYPTSDPGANTSLFGAYNGTSGTSGVWMGMNTGTLTMRINGDDGAANSTGSTTNAMTLNAWNHCAASCASATSRRGMLNGSIAGAVTNAVSRVPTGLNRVSVGTRDNAAASTFFPGQLAGASLFSRALPDEELVAISQGVSPRKFAGLIDVWPFFDFGAAVRGWKGNDMALTGTSISANEPPRFPFPGLI